MQAVLYRRYGGPEMLSCAPVPEPQPKRGEVVVQVHATSLNVIDSKARRGELWPLVNNRFPKIPGADLAGIVTAAGDGVTGFAIGDAVFGATSPFAGGTLAERVAVPAAQLAHKPASLGFPEAATLPVAGLAALQALRDLGQAGPGKTVLLHGASGGIGLFAIQLAKSFGAIVTAVGGPEGTDAMRRFGADTVIDYRQGDSSLAQGPYDIIMNASGRAPFAAARRALKPAGILIEPSPTIPAFIGANVANLFRSRKHKMLATAIRRADLEFLAAKAAAGALVPVIARSFPFAAFRDAFAAAERGGAAGKIVVVHPA